MPPPAAWQQGRFCRQARVCKQLEPDPDRAPASIQAALALTAHVARAQPGFALIPSPESIIAVRAVGATPVAAAVEELDPEGLPAPLQTATLPGCVLSTAMYQSYGSQAADNSAAYWSCGATGSLNRVVSRLMFNGTVQHLPYTTTNVAYLPRGVAAAASGAFYASDARGVR